MKLYATDGEVFLADFTSEALYDLVRGSKAAKGFATIILRVKTRRGVRMQIHFRELDLDRTFEREISKNVPPIKEPEHPVSRFGLDE